MLKEGEKLMRVHWHQFSPGEKEALVRHYVLHKRKAAVTAERICEAMQETHFLACVSPGGGRTLVEFVSSRPGIQAGAAIGTDLTDGIYQAALRAYGIDLDDKPTQKKTGATRKAGKHRHV